MLFAVIVLSVLLVLAAVAIWFSFTLNKRLSAFAVRFEENYEEAQDVLGEMYEELEKVLTKPVIVDDPVTNRVLTQLKTCREEVLRVARLISMQDDEKDGQEGRPDNTSE